MLFLVAIILNAVIHYAFKPKSLDYIHSVPQLIKLLGDSRRVVQISGVRQADERDSGCVGNTQTDPENRFIPSDGE